MDDERAAPSAAFALRLAADTLMALVLNGAMTKGLATVIVDQGLEALLESHPEYERSLREIAATLTTQIGMAVVGLEAERRKDAD